MHIVKMIKNCVILRFVSAGPSPSMLVCVCVCVCIVFYASLPAYVKVYVASVFGRQASTFQHML